MSTAELVINSISAIGAVAAAGIALAIATKDRKDRSKERHAADRAQARLVLVEIRTYVEGSAYHVDIVNLSAQPILNVVLDRVQIQGSDLRWQRSEDREGAIRLVKPEREEAPRCFTGEFFKPDGNPVAVEHGDDYNNSRFTEKPDASLVVAAVTFTDASGNIWSTDTEGTLDHRGTAD